MIAIANGDRDALAELYDRHAPSLLALGVRILGNRREAEDVVHDVFVEAWKRATEYDPERGRVKTWLMLRMRCRCIDRVKSAGYSRSRPLPADGDIGGGDTDDAESSPDVNRVREALASLPEDQRTVLMLGYFEGLSSSEIADRLGIPMGTVKSRVASAMAKLRASLRVTSEEV